DEDEGDLVAKQVKVDWDDEEDNAVPDSWDAEPPKDSETTKTVAPAKLSLSERLKLKEEQKRKEREEKLRREEELRLSQPVTELQREKLAEEAELGLLKDTFVTIKKQSIHVVQKPRKISITYTHYLRLRSQLYRQVPLIPNKLKQKSPHFTAFAESLIRDLVIEMEVDALRTVNTVINALINEKQKLVKVRNIKYFTF
ncbi:unnamed protein product, partial [Schistosoma curassoni]|uniref:Eukaryotic translation initiation factor 3 30 kDa subunit n=1 Tax=Schistosoma curassoni TaxID=6186 RepID=A0A183KQE4_9TREM